MSAVTRDGRASRWLQIGEQGGFAQRLFCFLLGVFWSWVVLVMVGLLILARNDRFLQEIAEVSSLRFFVAGAFSLITKLSRTPVILIRS
jgi:hypothetical protein